MKTNYIEQAIQKAQESGWKYEEDAPEEVMYKWKVFCDPNFWISLGKSLGWGGLYRRKENLYHCQNGLARRMASLH